MGASVSSPAMTSSAITLIQDNLSEEERQLWTSLGPNWTLPRSVLVYTLISFFLPVVESNIVHLMYKYIFRFLSYIFLLLFITTPQHFRGKYTTNI